MESHHTPVAGILTTVCLYLLGLSGVNGAFFLDLDRFSTDHECQRDSECGFDKYCEDSPLNNYVPFNLFGDSIFRKECREKKELFTVCLRDEMCQSSKCEMGRCVQCKVDSDCPTNMYCGGSVQWALTQVDSFFGFGFGRSVANFLNPDANACSFPKDGDAFCLRDLECISGACDLAHCVDNSTRDCYEDSDCRMSTEFCAGAQSGLERNRCMVRGKEGAYCLGSHQCQARLGCKKRQCTRITSERVAFRSSNSNLILPVNIGCLNGEDCGKGEFCVMPDEQQHERDTINTLLFSYYRRPKMSSSMLGSHCREKGALGSSCGQDEHCKWGICENHRCSQCRVDDDCDQRLEFCGRKGLMRLCQKKKCQGFCSEGRSCVSGVCTLFLCQDPEITCQDSELTKSQSFSDHF